MATDLSNYNDFQLQTILSNIEQEGKHAKAMMQAGSEPHKAKYNDLRERWKDVKREMDARANPAPKPAGGLSPAAGAPAPAPITPRDFHRMCAQHDWGYEYSDAPGAFRAGKESAAKIENAVRMQPELLPILQEWRAHLVAGGKRPSEPEA